MLFECYAVLCLFCFVMCFIYFVLLFVVGGRWIVFDFVWMLAF